MVLEAVDGDGLGERGLRECQAEDERHENFLHRDAVSFLR